MVILFLLLQKQEFFQFTEIHYHLKLHLKLHVDARYLIILFLYLLIITPTETTDFKTVTLPEPQTISP